MVGHDSEQNVFLLCLGDVLNEWAERACRVVSSRRYLTQKKTWRLVKTSDFSNSNFDDCFAIA